MDVRGDAALTARLLLRGTGLAGVFVVVGGALAAAGATRGWYLAVADLRMLGEQQGRVVASLAGIPGTPWGWLAVALGVTVAVIGARVAIDRPIPHVRLVLFVAAGAMLAVAVAAGLWSPSVDRVAGSDASDLVALADRLPTGIELTVVVQRGPGPVLLGIAALLVAAAALACED